MPIKLSIESDFDVTHTNSLSYTSIGVDLPLPVPMISFGRREKYGDSALDYSIGCAMAVVVSSVGEQCKYLKYLHHSNYYAGLGATMDMGIAAVVPVVFGAGPQVCFGKEDAHNFHQVTIRPFYVSTIAWMGWPSIAYTYGFNFKSYIRFVIR